MPPNLGRLATYGLVSTALTAWILLGAFRHRSNFYAAMVYLSKSNACMMILWNFGIFLTTLFGKFVQAIFFGPLRMLEIERLQERSWIAITETLLALTIFREEFDTGFVVLFVSLLFVKIFHWLAADRVELMEQTPQLPRFFHARIISALSLLWIVDFVLFASAMETVLFDGASVMIMFASEYMILLASVWSTSVKYGLNVYDLRSEVPWEAKSLYVLYVDMATDFLKLVSYSTFFFLILAFYGIPLNLLRDVYLTALSFIRKIKDLLRYREARRDMEERYPNATDEDLERMNDKTCIICREEMVGRNNPGATTNASGGAETVVDGNNLAAGSGARGTAGAEGRSSGVNETPKKLPCGHIFHFNCLRSWLERQQSCPTCRAPVIDRERQRQRPPFAAAAEVPPPAGGAGAPRDPARQAAQHLANGFVPRLNAEAAGVPDVRPPGAQRNGTGPTTTGASTSGSTAAPAPTPTTGSNVPPNTSGIGFSASGTAGSSSSGTTLPGRANSRSRRMGIPAATSETPADESSNPLLQFRPTMEDQHPSLGVDNSSQDPSSSSGLGTLGGYGLGGSGGYTPQAPFHRFGYPYSLGPVTQALGAAAGLSGVGASALHAGGNNPNGTWAFRLPDGRILNYGYRSGESNVTSTATAAPVPTGPGSGPAHNAPPSSTIPSAASTSAVHPSSRPQTGATSTVSSPNPFVASATTSASQETSTSSGSSLSKDRNSPESPPSAVDRDATLRAVLARRQAPGRSVQMDARLRARLDGDVLSPTTNARPGSASATTTSFSPISLIGSHPRAASAGTVETLNSLSSNQGRSSPATDVLQRGVNLSDVFQNQRRTSTSADVAQLIPLFDPSNPSHVYSPAEIIQRLPRVIRPLPARTAGVFVSPTSVESSIDGQGMDGLSSSASRQRIQEQFALLQEAQQGVATCVDRLKKLLESDEDLANAGVTPTPTPATFLAPETSVLTPSHQSLQTNDAS